MSDFKRYCLFVILTLLLTGCVNEEKYKTSSNAKISIEPYNLNEQESLLISKTGVEHIEFFKLNGTLAKDDDLQISVEVFEKGMYKGELLKTLDDPQRNYKDSLISFGISDYIDENRPLKLISGIPSGLTTTNYPNNMTSFSFGNLVGTKLDLKKNKPVYLAAWQGTTKNELRSVGSTKGESPAGIEETELAFLFKVLWTDKEKN